ncbi:MAG: TIGR00730 family Rossman fold protein [Chloroflexi bacterium]|nr:TIGR00730 family Rossman fold protein [Chloroflexota bacterium]OJV89206.1 MAG: Rossman fold protein, TIGR00730 family [Chloroflexi bacterium 54-19]
MIDGLQGKAIAVYCASSSAVSETYFEAARALGRAIAESGATLVYGGTNIGLMGEVADAVVNNGGKTCGVITVLLNQVGIAHPKLDELIVVDGMRERKAAMEQRADAFITLPGGYGTLEEIFEILTLKQLGILQKPIVLLNTGNYYGPLVDFLKTAAHLNFMKPSNLKFFDLLDTPEAALDYIASYTPGEYEPKWVLPRPSQSLGGEVPGTE